MSEQRAQDANEIRRAARDVGDRLRLAEWDGAHLRELAAQVAAVRAARAFPPVAQAILDGFLEAL